MNFYAKIALGILLGLVVGTINFILLRTFVRLALRSANRILGILVVIFSYAVRYVMIGAVILWLMKIGEQMMAFIVLTILAAMTILLAAWQQKRKQIKGA